MLLSLARAAYRGPKVLFRFLLSPCTECDILSWVKNFKDDSTAHITSSQPTSQRTHHCHCKDQGGDEVTKRKKKVFLSRCYIELYR